MYTIEKISRVILLIGILKLMYNYERAESKLNLRKFGITFKKFENDFEEKIRMDMLRKQEDEVEKKRAEIYREQLASRISGSILKDFYGRL